jgi:hypothetical protein
MRPKKPKYLCSRKGKEVELEGGESGGITPETTLKWEYDSEPLTGGGHEVCCGNNVHAW